MKRTLHTSLLLGRIGATAFLISQLPDAALAQVTAYDLFSSAQWFQTSDAPGFTENNAYGWFSDAHITVVSAADANSATLSTGGVNSPFAFTQNGTTLSLSTSYYATRADMEADFPTGQTYNYRITSGNLNGQVGALNAPSTPPYPNAIPTFANFSSFSAVDPNNATFQWNAWTPPTSASGEFVDVRDHSGNVLYSTFFSSGQTSFTVPSSTFSSGNNNYSVEVIFSSRMDSSIGQWQGGSPDALGGWDFRTSANFTTVPEPGATGLAAGLALAAVAGWRGTAKRRGGLQRAEG